VSVNDKLSSWSAVSSGVPQGSVLGPLLFTLFVNDIPKILSSFVSMFADDTKTYQAVANSQDMESLQQDLNSLQTWSINMQMKFHPEKCKVLHLGSSNTHNSYSMTKPDNNTHEIESIQEEKDLGVLIDSKLSFSNHVQQITNKAHRMLGLIRHTFKELDTTSFLHLYKSLVRPHLAYASPVWSPKFKRDRDAIEKVQRRATRLIKNASHMSYPERLKHLNLPTLEYRRKRADIIQCFKLIKGFDNTRTDIPCTICGNKLLQPATYTTTRGHSHKLQIQHHSGPKKSYFTARVSPLWNKLSQHTINSETVNTFKTRLANEWKDRHDLYDYIFSY
jgi:hypothetical protein